MSGKTKKNTVAAPYDGEVIPKKGFTDIPKWAPLIVCVFTALLYSNSLHNALTSFDDDFYILNNPFLKDFSWKGVKAIFTSFYTSNYHPLTTLTWLVEYHWFGADPFSYHLVNVVLHVLNTFVVYKVTEQLSGKRLTALIVSILFGVHPMHVESVAWVSERKDVLYTFFYLLSLSAYLRYISSALRPKYYLIAQLLFICSLMSKSAAVSLPVVLIAADLYKGRKITTRMIMEKVPFLLLSTLFGILNIMAQAEGGSINGIVASFGFINRIFLFTSAVASYLMRSVVPYHLSGMHYFPALLNGFFPWEYYLSLPLVAIVVWFIARRSAFRKELVFGSVFFLITVFLMLQIVSVGSALTAERYTYVSYIGLFYIFGQWVSGFETSKWRPLAIGLFAVAVVAYSAQTWNRIGIWKDDITLFNDMIETNPDVYFGYWMRGNLEKKDGDLPAALQDYNKSISLKPDFDDSYYNRAHVLDALGNTRAAISDYSEAIKINPKQADSYNNRGWAYYKTGDTATALTDLNKAILLKPTYHEAYNNRGWIYFQSGNTTAALQDFDHALAIKPGFNRARYNRASLKGNTGDLKGALDDFSYLVNNNPDEKAAYYYRGITYLRMKDTAAACPDFKSAQELGFEGAGKMIGQYCR